MLFRAVWILALVFAVGARAGTEIDYEFSGRLNVESRWFPEAGAHSGQRLRVGVDQVFWGVT